MGIKLLKHNQEAYEKVNEAFKTSNRTAVIHATGTGKTSIAAKWLEELNGEKTLYLAPNLIILDQVKEYMNESGLDVSSITFMTYAELMLKKDIEKYDKIVLDEFHRAGAPEWKKGVDRLLEVNSESKVLGLTATPRRYTDGKNMQSEIFHNNVASELPLTEAMQRGVIKIPTYVNAIYTFKESIENIQSKIDKMEDKKEKEKLQKQLNAIKRNVENAPGFSEIIKKHLPKKDGKYIVFCNDIKDMHKKMQEFNQIFKDINKTEIHEVSYRKSDKANKDTLHNFETIENKKTKLLFTVNKLNEGVHIKGIDGVFMMRSTGSPIMYMQQLGRALSISSEQAPIIFDLANNIYGSNYIYKLRDELKKGYKNAKEKQEQDDIQIGEFEIFDELFEYVDLLKSIDEKLERTTTSRTLSILETLSKNEVDLSKINVYTKKEGKQRYTFLREIPDENIEEVIEKNGLNSEQRLGYNLHELRKAYKKGKLTKEEKDKAEKLGVVEEKPFVIGEALKILEKLNKNGADLENIQLSRKEDGEKIYFLLKEVPDINIQKMIRENEIDGDWPIGYMITAIRAAYSNTDSYVITQNDRKKAEKLKILKKKTETSRVLDLLELLKQNGVDLNKIQSTINKNGKFDRFTSLKDIKNDNIQRIIEDNDLEPDFPIGKKIQLIRQVMNGSNDYKPTEKEKERFENLEMEKNLRSKTLVAKTIEVLEILSQNGMDTGNLKTRVRENGKQRFLTLKDIESENIEQIIEENNLDSDFKIGYNIYIIREADKGRGSSPITEEEKVKARKLGVVKDALSQKENEQQELIEKREKAKELVNLAKEKSKGTEQVD